MRTFKKILAAMLACTMLLSAGAALAEGETVTINFWHHYSAQSAENETLMNVLIPAFEAENPGIKVNAVMSQSGGAGAFFKSGKTAAQLF